MPRSPSVPTSTNLNIAELTSRAASNRAGRTGIKIPSHLRGYIKLTNALDTSCSIDVWDDNRIMRDSANANSKSVTIFAIDNDLNNPYRSV